MSLLLTRLLLIILAVWLIRWFLSSLFKNKQPPPSKQNSSRPEGNMVKDPICGMYMDPRLAVKHQARNGIFYFCSEECKNKFLKIPHGESPGNASSPT